MTNRNGRHVSRCQASDVPSELGVQSHVLTNLELAASVSAVKEMAGDNHHHDICAFMFSTSRIRWHQTVQHHLQRPVNNCPSHLYIVCKTLFPDFNVTSTAVMLIMVSQARIA